MYFVYQLMKQYFFLIVCCFCTFISFGQISHGGQPLFATYQPKTPLLKSSSSNFFIEMPSFNIGKLLEEDRLNEEKLRGGFRFANKFITAIERGKDGLNYELEDGTKIWQVGIRSKGAYSINVLFGEFNIPKGGKLFLYNSNRTHIIGSFTDENNRSGNNLLPTQPIEGDEIIVEYTEPFNTSFEGKLKITEVNHDYRNFFLKAGEPEVDQSEYPCMQDALCESAVKTENIRATVLLIINGISGCTGTLVNNTQNNEIPYLITAVHCLNSNPNIPQKMDYYMDKSGTIVTFFNYQRNICGSMMRGIENQTIAGSTALAVIEKRDIALLRLNETPPDYYNPYYSGWNIELNGGPNPHINLHHPNKTLKKTGVFKGNPSLATSPFPVFDTQVHWKVSAWASGATDGGSSGSPLFDASGLLIGGLSGGNSLCTGKFPNNGSDYFFALCKSWEYGAQDSINLKNWLDPKSTGTTRMEGLDPLKDYPMVILSNANYNASVPDTLVTTPVNGSATGSLFGHNSLQKTNEFAEVFTAESETELIGSYLMIPPITGFNGTASPVKINVYTGENRPEILVSTVLFNPTYLIYNVSEKGFNSNPTTMNRAKGTENFVLFPENLKVKGNFYISYEISFPSTFNFSVYNAAFGSKKKNTAWIKKSSGEWISADKYSEQPITTSLAIQAVVIKGKVTGEEIPIEKPNIATYDRQNKVLYVNAKIGERGIVSIYSITGSLIHNYTFAGAQSFIINAGQGPVIVKVVSNIRNSAMKILF